MTMFTIDNLKQVIAMHEKISKFLNSKDALNLELSIKEDVETAGMFMNRAMLKSLEGSGEIARRDRIELEHSPFFPTMESDMTLSAVDKTTGEVRSVTIDAKDRLRVLDAVEKGEA